MAKDDRLFAPFPIEMDEHPKIIGLTDAAFRAVFEATFYSRRMLSDGFLDERIVLRKWGQPVADELSSNDPLRPSWIPVEHGWRIHDFEKHHPLRAEIEAKRAATSAANSAKGRRSGEARRTKAEQIANQTEPESNRYGTESNSETETETETTTASAVATAPKRKAETALPDSWVPSPSNVAYASANGLDVKHEAEQFRAHAGANDRRQRDWDSSFRTWLGNAAKWAKPADKPKHDPNAWMNAPRKATA